MVRFVVVAVVLLFAHAADARAQVDNGAYNSLNGVSLDAFAYVSEQARSVTFDTATFTATEEYSSGPSSAQVYAGCGAWGAKTAWVRFVSGAQGRLAVAIDSSGPPAYDVFFKVYSVPTSTAAPGTALITQLKEEGCNNSTTGGPGETYTFEGGVAVPPDATIYVQVLSVCANRTAQGSFCTSDEQAAAVGGPTKLSLTYRPDDRDGDGFADTLDDCPDAAGTSNLAGVDGCPDQDGDGAADTADQCPSVPGPEAGCPSTDNDGDGYKTQTAGGEDCDDNDPAVNPGVAEDLATERDDNCDGKTFPDADRDGFDDRSAADCDGGRDPDINRSAKEIRGNRVDEDCRNGAAPFRSLQNRIVPIVLRVKNTVVGFAGFNVFGAFDGLKVTVLCSGSDCPFGKRTFNPEKKGKLTVAKQFERVKGAFRRLRPGTKVTIHLTAPKRVGKALRYRIAGKGVPATRVLCSEAGSNELLPRKRCAGFS